MTGIEWLFQRRSIRKYHNTPVEDDKIELLLQAGMAAPSAKNKRPWHFVVIKDRGTLEAIRRIHPYASMLAEAPLAIAVCGNHREPFWVQDCSAAMQNILLAATSLGLGSVWLGVYPKEDLVKEVTGFLSLEPPYTPLGLAAIGYPAEDKPPKDLFESDKMTVIQ